MFRRHWTQGHSKCPYSCVSVCIQGCPLRTDREVATGDFEEGSGLVGWGLLTELGPNLGTVAEAVYHIGTGGTQRRLHGIPT